MKLSEWRNFIHGVWELSPTGDWVTPITSIALMGIVGLLWFGSALVALLCGFSAITVLRYGEGWPYRPVKAGDRIRAHDGTIIMEFDRDEYVPCSARCFKQGSLVSH